MFVAREAAWDAGQFARQMARSEVRAASIAWPTWDELTQEQRQDAEREERERRGLPTEPEPEQDRDRQKEGRGLRLGK